MSSTVATRPPSMIAMPGLGGVNPLDLKNKLKPVSSTSKASVSPEYYLLWMFVIDFV